MKMEHGDSVAEDTSSPDSENAMEEEIKTLKLELMSQKNQNISLIQIIQKFKLNSSSDQKSIFDLKRNQHKLNVQLNWFQEELNRANGVVNISEEKITDAFKNVMETSRTLSECRVLLSRFSTRYEMCQTQKQNHNSLTTGNPSYVQKNSAQAKHRVGPMVRGHPISKPTIKLQRLKMPSQTSSENVTGPAAYPALPTTDSALPVAEPLLAVADMALTAGDPELPVVDVTLPAVEQEVDPNDCESYLLALGTNISTTFESLTEVSKHLLNGKEAIKQYYSTPARSIDDSFTLLTSGSSNNCSGDNHLQKQSYANQTSQRVGPMVEGHTIITNPTIIVERIDATTFVENFNHSPTPGTSSDSEHSYQCSPVFEDSAGERMAMAENDSQIISVPEINDTHISHADQSSHQVGPLTNPTVNVERVHATISLENVNMRKKTEYVNESTSRHSTMDDVSTENLENEILPVADDNVPVNICADQSSHQVVPLVEAHAIITNPTVIMERVDATISLENVNILKNPGRRRKNIIVNEDSDCSTQEPGSSNSIPNIRLEGQSTGRKRKNKIVKEDSDCSMQEPGSSNSTLNIRLGQSTADQSSHQVGPLANPTVNVERVDATISLENLKIRKPPGRRRKNIIVNEDSDCSMQEPGSSNSTPNIILEGQSTADQSSHLVGPLANPTVNVERVDATISLENVKIRKQRGRKRKNIIVNEDADCSMQEPGSSNSTPNIRLEGQSTADQSSHQVGPLANPTVNVERVDATISLENVKIRKPPGRKRKNKIVNEDSDCSMQQPGSSNSTPNIRLEGQSTADQSSHQVGPQANPTVNVERVDATISLENIKIRKPPGRKRNNKIVNEDSDCSMQEPGSSNSTPNIRLEGQSTDSRRRRKNTCSSNKSNDNIHLGEPGPNNATPNIRQEEKSAADSKRGRKNTCLSKESNHSIHEPGSSNATPNVKQEEDSAADSKRRRKNTCLSKESNDSIHEPGSSNATPNAEQEEDSAADTSRRRRPVVSYKELNLNKKMRRDT